MVFAMAVSMFARRSFAEQPLDVVTVGDLPGTNGAWQFGEVTVAAPADQVHRWFDEVGRWQGRFPDIEWVQALGATPDGRRIVRFRSSIIGRTMTIRMREQPGSIVYDGEGKDVTTRGKILIERRADRTTHVILQSTTEVHGAAGLFASKNLKRERAHRKFRSDLTSIARLSHTWAAAQRRGG